MDQFGGVFFAPTVGLPSAPVEYTIVGAPLAMSAIMYLMDKDGYSDTAMSSAVLQAGSVAAVLAASSYFTGGVYGGIEYSSMEFLVPIAVAAGAAWLNGPMMFYGYPAGYIAGAAALAYYTPSPFTRKFALLAASLPAQVYATVQLGKETTMDGYEQYVGISLATLAAASLLDVLMGYSVAWKRNIGYGVGSGVAAYVNNAVAMNSSAATQYSPAGVTAAAWLLSDMILSTM